MVLVTATLVRRYYTIASLATDDVVVCFCLLHYAQAGCVSGIQSSSSGTSIVCFQPFALLAANARVFCTI